MLFSIGQDTEVRIPIGASSNQSVTEDGGAILWAVKERIQVFLPAEEYPSDPRERTNFLRDLRRPHTVTVRVIGYDDAQDIWTVSRREMLNGNPWQDEVPNWKQGCTIKRMHVTNVHADQVYGEIMPGVEGRVSLHEIREHISIRDELAVVPLVGDYIIGYVKAPEFINRVVPLDVISYFRHMESEARDESHSPMIPVFYSTEKYVRSKNLITSTALRAVLVVDDEERYLEAMKNRLESDGLNVVCADSLQSAMIHAGLFGSEEDKDTVSDIDVAIIDINLSKADPIEGLKFAKQLRDHRPEIKILLMSGDPGIRKNLAQGDSLELQIHGFIAKPFGFSRLRAELAKVALAAPVLPTSLLSPDVDAVNLTPNRPEKELENVAMQRVQDFCERVGADKVALFALHPISLDTDVIVGAKPTKLWQGRGWGFWRHKLRQSPVRDVAIDSISILEEDALIDSHYPRHRWLQRAYGYRSCLGVPVRVVGEHAYCLFAFHVSCNAFTEEHKRVAEMAAVELAAIVEKERLLRIFEAETRYVTSGITLNVLGHELGTILSTIALNSETIIDLIDTPGKQSSDYRAQAIELREAANHSIEICEAFLELARKGQVKPVSVRDCIERAFLFAKRRVEEMDVRLVACEIPDTIYVRAERAVLEQALFNLFINAAEQSQLFGIRQGRIEISSHYSEENSNHVQVFVKDNGPGIHYCWWDEIFKPGFTTKRQGSGLGLHICQRALESLTGTIRVLSSDLWVGTTFVLTMPAALSGEEGK